MMTRTRLTLFVFLLSISSLNAADWPQLQNNPQRTGYSTETIDVPIAETWVREFGAERIHPQVQPIVVSTSVLFGTQMGTFYSLDAKTGGTRWKYPPLGHVGPILHTAAAAGGKVYFASMDGMVYALNIADGTQVWVFDSQRPSGFSTAVLFAEGKVLVASREGRFYALDPNTGGVLWQRDVGAPILMSSAYDNGRIFFGTLDLRVFALNAADGSIAWQTPPLHGSALKDYWPVVSQGKVFIRTKGFENFGFANVYAAAPLSLSVGLLPQTELDKQTTIIQQYDSDPRRKTLYVFDEITGQETGSFAHWNIVTLNSTAPPPCLDGDGKLVMPLMAVDWRGAWGRMDIAQKKITELLWDGQYYNGTYPDGGGNPDEEVAASSAGRLVVTAHVQEGNAFYTGYYHLDRRQWTRMVPYHTGSYWEKADEGEADPAAISNGMIYHNTFGNINARTATVVP